MIVSELQPHHQRVVDELDDLAGRLAKLRVFLRGNMFLTLSEAERSRLNNQARFMDGYAAVLQERIEAFSKP